MKESPHHWYYFGDLIPFDIARSDGIHRRLFWCCCSQRLARKEETALVVDVAFATALSLSLMEEASVWKIFLVEQTAMVLMLEESSVLSQILSRNRRRLQQQSCFKRR
jgi:hypothetical protein